MREHQKAWASKVSGFHLAHKEVPKILHGTDKITGAREVHETDMVSVRDMDNLVYDIFWNHILLFFVP